MKKIGICWVFLFFNVYILQAQTLAFKDDFKLEENDMDALIHQYKIDQNGNKMAIIKMVNPNKGFAFDIGSIGDALVEEKKGETWVYVPQNTKRITVNHESLGVLRNYEIPLEIEAGRVYSVTLISGIVNKEIKEVFNKGFLTIETDPTNAEVFKDNKSFLITPINSEGIITGKYHIKISKALYYDFDTTVDIKINEHIKINKRLKPKFGYLNINTTPLSGATIEIDDEEKPNKTPTIIDKLKAGTHTLKITYPEYETYKQNFTITENQTTNILATLKPNFGFIKIYAKPAGANIFIDNKLIGQDSILKKYNASQYLVEVKIENYKTASKTISISPATTTIDSFNLDHLLSDLVVTTIPDEATIYLDNQLISSLSPTQIPDVFVGEHHIVLKKTGYITVDKNIYIKDKETYNLKQELQKIYGSLLNVSCNNTTDVKVFANNIFIGTTPIKNFEFKKGLTHFRFEKNGYKTFVKIKKIDSTEEFLNITMEDGFDETDNVKLQTNEYLHEVEFKSNYAGGKLFIDNKYIGILPINYKLALGYYKIVIKQDDFIKYTSAIFIHDSVGEINIERTKINRLIFGGIKIGLTQSNIQILANNTMPLSPYKNYTTIDNLPPIYQPTNLTAFYIGGKCEVFTSLKRKFSYQIEALITNIGATYNENALSIQQIRFPISVKWYALPRVWAITLNASYNTTLSANYKGQDIRSQIQSTNISYGVGTEINFGRNMYVGVNYNVEQKPILVSDNGSSAISYPPISTHLFLGIRF